MYVTKYLNKKAVTRKNKRDIRHKQSKMANINSKLISNFIIHKWIQPGAEWGRTRWRRCSGDPGVVLGTS